jgi:hypothetical protein
VLPVSSCIFGRKRPLPPPAPAPVQLPSDHQPPQHIEEPPEIIPPELPPPAPRLEIPSAPPKTGSQADDPDRPRRRPTAPAPAPSALPEAPPTAAPAKVPQLAPLISDEERRAYDTAIDAILARTTQNLMRARGRTLSAAEKDSLVRAEAFLEQARETRKVDPAAARSLAERAELLSRHAAGQ